MIVEFILVMFFNLITFIFGLFQLPLMPLGMAASITQLTQFLAVPLGVFSNYIGASYITSVLTLFLVVIVFLPGFQLAIWIYKRIKG